MAKNQMFPKKTFLIVNKLKKYTPILHFFTSIRQFNSMPTENVVLTCKENNCRLESSIGDFSNINKNFTNKPNDHPISNGKHCIKKNHKKKKK